MSSVRAIFANDLSSFPHIGCELVNENLKQEIRAIASLAGTIRHDQLAQPQAFRTVGEGDVLVINGEGNFHGRNLRKLGEIMALATEGRRLGKRVALINTVGQDIPDGLDLGVFDFVSVRESESGRVFREAGYQGELMVAPDGTLLTEYTAAQPRRDRIVVTDSVLRSPTHDLRALARELRGRKLDVVYTTFRKSWLRGRSVRAMLDLFGSARLVVAGRFHANCFAFITQTPVVSVDSNTHKTRSMMQDFGFGAQHFDDFGALRAWVFKEAEREYRGASGTTSAQLGQCRQTIRTALQRALGVSK